MSNNKHRFDAPPGTKHDFGGVYCCVELIVLYRRHPLVSALGLTARELLDYLALWGMCVEFRRQKLPEPFTFTPAGFGHIARHVGSDRRIVRSMLTRSLQKRNGKSLIKVDRKKRITVCGVIIKHGRFQFLDVAKVSPQRKVYRVPRAGQQSKAKQSKAKEEYNCPPELLPIQKAINAINATNYDRVRMDPTYENIFRTSAEIFMQQGEKNGLARCVTEIIKLSGWLEGQFDIGRLKRDARHNPRQRITNWFRNAIKPRPPRDNEQIYQPPNESRRRGDAVLLGDILKKSAGLKGE